MKKQLCFQCEQPTGRTRSEDSIYRWIKGQGNVGPLCEECVALIDGPPGMKIFYCQCGDVAAVIIAENTAEAELLLGSREGDPEFTLLGIANDNQASDVIMRISGSPS